MSNYERFASYPIDKTCMKISVDKPDFAENKILSSLYSVSSIKLLNVLVTDLIIWMNVLQVSVYNKTTCSFI